MNEVMRAHRWVTNAAMIADVARLGLISEEVFDATYGEGAFWTEWKPDTLITNDLHKPAQFHEDYRSLPFPDAIFSTVALDPDYKMQGTPTPDSEMDRRYGTGEVKRWQDRLDDIVTGAVECYRVCGGRLLVKCMDQVVSGKVVWQTDDVTRAVEQAGGHKTNRFDFLSAPRPQPGVQKTERANYSTLLVFAR